MTGKRKNNGDKSRAERLKAALRENLRRRKAQERQRAPSAVSAARAREKRDPEP